MRFFLILFLSLFSFAAPTCAQNAAVAEKVEEALKSAETKISDEQIKLLISTLENQAEREAFLAKLKALQAAQTGEPKSEPKVPSVQALDHLSGIMNSASQNLGMIIRSFADLPQASRWLEKQLQTEETRQGWLNVFVQTSLSLLAGVLGLFLLRLLTSRPRGLLANMHTTGLPSKLLVFFGHHLLALLPVIAFTGAALFTLGAFELPAKAGRAAGAILNAFIALQAVIWVLQMVFAERTPRLRLLPLADESAAYLFVWCARLAGLIIFGFFMAQAGLVLDVPKGSVHAFAALIGLVITLMVIVIVLQNRAVVADWLRGKGGEADGKKADFIAASRARLADIWHVLAIVYLSIGFLVAALDIEQGFSTLLRATLVTVLTLVLFRLLLGAIDNLVARGFALPAELKKQFPFLEERTNSYLPIIEKVVKGLVWVIGLLVIINAWGLDTSAWFASPLGKRVLSASISIAFTLFVVVVLWEIVSTLVERFLQAEDRDGKRIERSGRMRTLLPLLRYTLHVLMVLVAGLIILSEVGVDITPLLAGAGIIGLAVGFGAQTLVKDFITGLFILLEDTIAVGDVVHVGNHKGTVELITIRTLRLRDLEGHVHSVPFSEVTSVVNLTKNYAFALIEVGVGYDSDLAQVKNVMKDVGESLRADPSWRYYIFEPIEMLGVERFDASSIAIRARIKVDGQKQWAIKREYLLRLKTAFDKAGIEIPFPIVTNIHAAKTPADASLVEAEMKL